MDEKTIDRFWSHVNKTETCWLWKSTLRAGYGMFSFKGKPVSAHRWSYTLAYGDIPEGLLIRHSNECVARACVRPDHLSSGTQWDNMQDRRAAGGYSIPVPYQPKGPRGRKRKLTLEQIAEIMEALKSPYWGQVNRLAEKYGTTHSTISNLKHGHWFPAHITPEEL